MNRGAPPPVRRKGRTRTALACVAIWLSACASLPPTQQGSDSTTRNYAGRFSLAVTSAAPAGAARNEAWSGRFSLAVGARALSLDLVSPLGATIARFETDAQEARLLVPADGGVRVEHGTDAQSLAERVLGWSLPIGSMPDWIAGHPASGRPFRVLAADPGAGERVDADRTGATAAHAGANPGPDRFEQDGWAVAVEQPNAQRAGLRVQMSRAQRHDSPGVALRVVLDAPQPVPDSALPVAGEPSAQ